MKAKTLTQFAEMHMITLDAVKDRAAKTGQSLQNALQELIHEAYQIYLFQNTTKRSK